MRRYLKKPIFIITVILLFIILEVLALFLNYWIYQQKVQTVLFKQRQTFNEQIELVHKNLRYMADLFERFKVEEVPQVKNILYRALSHPKEFKKLHSKLYTLLKDDYIYMQSFGLRQLHFHLPGPISFVRFHRPDKFGDDLSKVREDLVWVNRTKKPLSVFSEGRIFNGFRNIYPLFKNSKFIGTVEISYSFEAMQKRLLQVDNESAYVFVVKKSLVKRKLFKSEKLNYLATPLLQGWVYDRKPLQIKMFLPFEQIEEIEKELAKKLLAVMQKGDNRSFLNHLNKKFIIVTLLPVKNIKKEVAAYIIQFKNSPLIAALYTNMRYSALFLTIFVLLLTFLIALFLAHFLKTREAAVYDLLTGIFNRRQFNTFFEHFLAQKRRYGEPLSLIFCDIDHFKKINDTFGHDVGDKVLKELARVIKTNIRQSDIFARWGGEEFVILLPQTSLSDAVKLAKKLRQIIEAHTFPLPQKVTCSFGVIEVKEENIQKALKRVDELLYRAKEGGRNRVEA